MQQVEIICAVPAGAGWVPVHHMTELLAHYLGATMRRVNPAASLNTSTKILGRLPRPVRGRRIALVVAYDPGQLYAIAQLPLVVRGYSAVYGWVIDSFWSERIPRIASSGVYERIFVADRDDLPDWHAAGVNNVGVMPWGANVWGEYEKRLKNLHKPTDLLRVGRQPEAYNTDEATGRTAREHGLSFAGRPPFGDSDEESARHLNQALAGAKFLLAFSTKVSPAPYTHPTKEYLTGRWTDALAHGCTVVGQVPQTTTVREILWQEATIDIDPTNLNAGVERIAELSASWSPDTAKNQMRKALATLDWRHRFSELFQVMGVHSDSLEADLADIAQHVK